MNNVSFSLAFVAGILSFASPCVLPLLPGYVSFITGISPTEKPKSPIDTLLPLILFVAGFTLVFTMIGATATVIGSVLDSNKVLLSKIAGILIIFFGLILMGLIKLNIFEKSNQDFLQKTKNSSSFVMGLAFAIGWSPCIGIVLSSVLAYAAAAKTVPIGVGLLFTYSLGLGIPFIIFGQIFAISKYRFDWLNKHTNILNKISGILLIIMGVLLFSDKLSLITIYLQKIIPKNLQYF